MQEMKAKFKDKRWVRILLVITIVGLTFLIAGMVLLCILIKYYYDTKPELDLNKIRNVSMTSYIYDCNGEVITTYNDTEYRDWVSLEDIPVNLRNAFISVEDRTFYFHHGINKKRLIGAVLSWVTQQDVYGGSTITQQLIKNTILTSDATIKRKIQELFLATELENTISKDEILEAYLNVIYLGNNNYGVLSAAKDYFGKENLNTLTMKECALLAGLTQNPYYYDPRANMYSRDAFNRNEDRIGTVLYAMQTNGLITEDDYYDILSEDITIRESSDAFKMYDAPHFVEYVVTDVIDGFLEYRGLPDTPPNRQAIESEIRNGGYRIYTTLEPEVQNAVQQSLSQYDGYPVFNIDDNRNCKDTSPQAAAVVIDQSTGNVVAMVGSKDTPTVKKSLNRAITSSMPVGSIIKPISVYGPALEAGLSPGSATYNFASKIEGYDVNIGYPGGGLKNQGVFSLRESLKESLNSTTARILVEDVGFNKSTEYLTRMGIDRHSIQITGSGLALGSSGIDMLDVTAAYAMIANGGVYKEPRGYIMVTDSNGTVILNAAAVKAERRVFRETTCWMLTDMMEDVISTGTGTNAKLNNITAAGKTGTNQNNSITFAGFTTYYTSAVWVGNDYFLGFDDSYGSNNVTAPLWKKYMDLIHEGMSDAPIQKHTPDELGLVKIKLCSVSGQLATDACGDMITEDWCDPDFIPSQDCEMHRIVPLCESSGALLTPDCIGPSINGYIMVVPNNSTLFKIDHSLIKSLFPNVIIGDEELNSFLDNNGCLLHAPNINTEEILQDTADN